MGTSSSGGGAGPRNPLLPSWIPPFDSPQPPIPPDNENQEPNNPNDDGEQPTDESGQPNDESGQPNNGENALPDLNPLPHTNRYRQPKSDFNDYAKSGGNNSQAFKDALKGYSKSANGSTRTLARRMRPSATRAAEFYRTLNTIRENGITAALNSFDLASYVGRPILDTLSALSDQIFKKNDNPFDNTQDDSITKLAYSNTVVRICEDQQIDLDNLTNEQIEVMLAVFIEETIVQRVICDIGNRMTEIQVDIDSLLEIEENAYQIVNGLVRNRIMPEIIATQRGDKSDIEDKIENIYRIAFDALGGAEN